MTLFRHLSGFRALFALCFVAPFLAVAAELPVDEVIVRYRSTAASFAAADDVARWVDGRTAIVRVPPPRSAAERRSGKALQELMSHLRGRGDVQFVEPNHRGYFEDLPAVALPNDPQISSQWWLTAVRATSQWAVSKGEGITVAVVDSGVDLSHPDLAANLLHAGYDFGDAKPGAQDRLGHGSAVAGVIAAVQNNAAGVSGLAPAARLLPVKINAGGEGSFLSDRLAQAINYAIDQGARVINLSLVVSEQTETVREAVQRALDRGIVVVVAAGNSGGPVAFPANMPGVVAVAATTQGDQLWVGSNRGSEIAIAAPGESIYSTDLNGGYRSRTGTSLAAPVVSASAAAVLAVSPALSREQVRSLIRSTARSLQPASGDFGVLDAGELLLAQLPRLQVASAEVSSASRLEVSYTLPLQPAVTDVYVAIDTPAGTLSLLPDGSLVPVSSAYSPVAIGYRSDARQAGVLFGPAGLFPAINLSGVTPGDYVLRTALVERATGRVVGAVNSTSVKVLP